MLESIDQFESNVRGYVRLFPTVFETARGSELWDCDGKRFIDFFCGAGTLNYGHNNPRAKAALMDYLSRDGIQHSLDTATTAKIAFMEAFNEIILSPRKLNYKIQFTGPTGTNAVEAAIKLAQKATQRTPVISFTHAYHGHTLGSLALTANSYFHDENYAVPGYVSRLPFDGYHPGLNSADLLRQMLSDPSSGLARPAAVILETVQGEGGINVASKLWLQEIEQMCRDFGVLLIIDDIQVGNGRTGQFFSFEDSGINPDIVCLSKSLGGGLPLAVNLIKPEFDAWLPGQHTGTFRGNNLAFVAATALLSHWRDSEFAVHIDVLRQNTLARLAKITQAHPDFPLNVRGRGLIQGLDVQCGKRARSIIDRCFEKGLLIEASGANDEVIKLMPSLVISVGMLLEGLDIIEVAVRDTLDRERQQKSGMSESASSSASTTPIVADFGTPLIGDATGGIISGS